MRYVIEDEETGNIITSDSVSITKDEIIYTSFTGEANGIEYSHNEETANSILHRIEHILNKYNIAKEFKIVHILRKDIPEGEMVMKSYPRKLTKVA